MFADDMLTEVYTSALFDVGFTHDVDSGSASVNAIFSPAPRRTLPEETTGKLLQAIITGRLEAGQKINEVEIASLLQVSRGPVREALAYLLGSGLVVRVANRGTFVVRFSRVDVEEVCSLRAALELFAVDRIIDMDSHKELQAMRPLVEGMVSASEETNANVALSRLDLQFHAALVDASRHNRLLSAWNTLRPQLQTLIYSQNVLNASDRATALISHSEILEALLRGDRDEARSLVQRHLYASYERLRRGFAEAEPGREAQRPAQ